jgi:glycine oxidase
MALSNTGRSCAPRIAIAGGGAAGLSAALALLARGAAVTVIEARGRPGQGAMWASGGMLAPGFECAAETDPDHKLAEDFAALCAKAGHVWPDFAARAEAGGGKPAGYARTGSILPLASEGEAERFEAAAAQAARLGIAAMRLDAAEAARREPGLAAVREALWFAGDGQVDNRALGEALARAVERAGGTLRCGQPATGLIETGGAARGVVLASGERIEADAVLAATGAAAGLHPALPAITPIKGQMIAFRMPPEAMPRAVIRGFGAYLSAKPGGRLVAGASSEPGEAGLGTDPATLERLARGARRIWPALEDVPPAESWAGLRPATADGMPALGAARGVEGLFMALGGRRNGVLLSPLMGEAAAEAILNGALPRWAAAFDGAREGLG